MDIANGHKKYGNTLVPLILSNRLPVKKVEMKLPDAKKGKAKAINSGEQFLLFAIGTRKNINVVTRNDNKNTGNATR